jgi:D-serine deaminase-like pyridoxal phosphate-dependent protein
VAPEGSVAANNLQLASQLAGVLRDNSLPVAFVDVAAFDRNLARLLLPAGLHAKKVRLATKSLRCPALIERAMQRSEGLIHGLMTFTARETLLWAERGAADLLLGYPLSGPHDAQLLVQANRLTRAAAMIDAPQHVKWLADAAQAAQVTLPVWLDLDMGWRPLQGTHIGVRRSPLRTPHDVVALAQLVVAQPFLELRGLMGYEAHVAGLPDDGRLASWQNPLKRWIKERSWPDILVRRGQAVEALRAAGLLPTDGRFSCNGGGSGSVDRTTQDASVTEITIGSGLLVGHLFDGYRGLALAPSLHFALAINREPSPGIVTCAGGGWIASGSAGSDRLPMPIWPPGSTLLPVEGAGEVQTPLLLADGVVANIGDAVIFRPAKSGELAEVFGHYSLLSDGVLGEAVPTYRGLGWSAWG